MNTITQPRRLAVAGTALVLAFGLAACGGDSGGAADDTAAAPTTAAEDTTAEFCSTVVGIDSTINSTPPPEALPPDQAPAILAQVGQQLEPQLARAEQLAPPEISGDVATAARITRQGFGGDMAAFESPELAPAEANIDRYMLDNCGFPQTEVTAVNFEFQDLPDSLPAGMSAVTLTNEGEDLHEIAVLRINDDVTMSAEELLALPQEQALSMVKIVGITFAAPGETTTAFVDAQPGRYFAACFIPEGTTPTAEGEGPPHFTLGMLKEFNVA
jgi:hypothetical protein